MDFVPEDSQYNKILLGAGSDMTKYIDYQFTITPGKRKCTCIPCLMTVRLTLNSLVAEGIFI